MENKQVKTFNTYTNIKKKRKRNKKKKQIEQTEIKPKKELYFTCQFCDGDKVLYTRKEYFKHIKTQEHKSLLNYNRLIDKFRTQLQVNLLAPPSIHKFKSTKSKLVHNYIKKLIEEEEFTIHENQ